MKTYKHYLKKCSAGRLVVLQRKFQYMEACGRAVGGEEVRESVLRSGPKARMVERGTGVKVRAWSHPLGMFVGGLVVMLFTLFGNKKEVH